MALAEHRYEFLAQRLLMSVRVREVAKTKHEGESELQRCKHPEVTHRDRYGAIEQLSDV
jgi:hypothetical protein